MSVYGFEQEETQRIAKATRRVEAMAESVPGGDRTPSAPVRIVRITGDMDATTKLYPGNVITYTHNGTGCDVNTLGEVRVYSATSLRNGAEVLCRFSGATSDGAFGMYVPCWGGAWVTPDSESLTAVPATTQTGQAVYLTFLGTHGNLSTPSLVQLFVYGYWYWATPTGGTEGGLPVYETGHYHIQRCVTMCVDGIYRTDRWRVPGMIVDEDVDCEEE